VKTRLLRRLPDMWISCDLKMAYVNMQFICIISVSLRNKGYTLGFRCISSVLMPDPKTWVWPLEFHCYLVWELRYAFSYLLPGTDYTVSGFPLINPSDSLHSNLIVWPDLEKVSTAVWLSQLSCIGAHKYVMPNSITWLHALFSNITVCRRG
jgi:hypothetical protein